ncbi:hypothetical protein AB0392_59060, partial [Nonomuraea angiospora]
MTTPPAADSPDRPPPDQLKGIASGQGRVYQAAGNQTINIFGGNVSPGATHQVRLVEVERADPRRLGVHAAIDAPGATGELPVYVERDTDTDPRGVRGLLTTASTDGRGGFVLLVGGSSVGKTRCAYEAIRAVVPTWRLLHPADANHIRQAAADPPERLVVWLDELQRYLGGAAGLNAATVRTLLNTGTIVVATLWPDHHVAYTTPPAPGTDDPHTVERELLSLADIVHLDATFTTAEQTRAQAAAHAGDTRIAIALQSADYGLTQVIAAAPQLINRWRGADPYAAAVLSAAIDAARLGARSPLPADLLRAAAPGYCDARQRAAAPTNWFGAALAYATQRLNGAAAALAPISAPNAMGPEAMGITAGYLVADYLHQHAGHVRRMVKIPATFWSALLDHLTDAGDLYRLGQAAQDRLLYRCAEPLYRHAAIAGDQEAAQARAELLTEQGRVEEALEAWRELVDDIGNSWWYPAKRLAELLAEQGREDELRARADAGDEQAARVLAELLAEQGCEEELRARADAGDKQAARALARLLTEQGRVEEALEAWRELADDTDSSWYPARQLAELLAEQGREGELRARADAGDEQAAEVMAELLAEQGREEELRARADAGDKAAARALAELLTEQGRVEEALEAWRELADDIDSSWYPAKRLAELLAEQGREGELRARADAGDEQAAEVLAELLAEQGREGELRARADAGDKEAARALAELLTEQGRVEEA